MYRQKIAKQTSFSLASMTINKQAVPTSSYGSLSGTIQRATVSPKTLSEDEWFQLDSVIGTRATNEIKSGKRTSYVPEFTDISTQLAQESGQNLAPIQAKQTDGAVKKKEQEQRQTVIEGADPIADKDILDPSHINDLLYGLTEYRGVTMKRMAEQDEPKRTVDQYNESVGIDKNVISGRTAAYGIYLVRNALEAPAKWKEFLPSKVEYPKKKEIKTYEQGKGGLSNEQIWMTFLVKDKYNIGLWDLGNTNRPVIKNDTTGKKQSGEAEGLTRIKSKERLEKNTHEDDAGTISAEEVHKMLSFGLNTKAATDYYYSLDKKKQEGLSRWIQNAFWRRTSKLGIDFATSDMGLNARVHFNLTSGVKQGGAWKAKLWGILDEKAEKKGMRKITESEWLYIERMMEKNPEMLERIIPYSESPL